MKPFNAWITHVLSPLIFCVVSIEGETIGIFSFDFSTPPTYRRKNVEFGFSLLLLSIEISFCWSIPFSFSVWFSSSISSSVSVPFSYSYSGTLWLLFSFVTVIVEDKWKEFIVGVFRGSERGLFNSSKLWNDFWSNNLSFEDLTCDKLIILEEFWRISFSFFS